ncbi:cell division protein ZapE [Rickettsiella grylli]|uniref:AFG1-family ATPase n=1 Tax=Rickettsiella grylli TaxID=59196 RepID=A8PLP6_9COXI|nr:cell division protein ZapE [Rickettsiella grylli]EDP45887.1 AFG1-family ATPase [Rickettsiella grylli]
MTPFTAYQEQIALGILQPDAQQALAMQEFQAIYDELVTSKKWFFKKKSPQKGLYLWGRVGRGKTYLMDLFYHHLPVAKSRYHFHQFMQHVHAELIQRQGIPNPLKQIAKRLRKEVHIICLDEFLVHEIADALLLAELLKALLTEDIRLVMTANVSPEDLYANGLQRELFLPAIHLIQQHLRIFHLDNTIDYRHDPSKEENSVVWVMNPSHVHTLFDQLRKKEAVHYRALNINGRLISHKGCTQQVIWFDFQSICSIPRNQLDYLAIAQRFSTILISNVKPIAKEDDNRARLFIHLIDILYDANRTLILTSTLPIHTLYIPGRLGFEFERTKSRLAHFKKQWYT